MSVETARQYFEVSDKVESTAEDIAALFTEDAILKSPREGIFRGQEEVQRFYGLNEEFFAAGEHNIDRYYEDGDVVVCEGTINGRTTAGREYEGVGLVDVMEFDKNDDICELRVYLDYSAVLSELPEDAPDFRK